MADAIRPTRFRRWLQWLMLLVVAFALTGVVWIPASSQSRNGSPERFPCESSRCGCSTAMDCWNQCCCNSDREKLAWAKANDVTPPDFLIARVTKPVECVASTKRVGAAKAPCCQSRSTAAAARADEPQEAQKAETSSVGSGGSLVLVWKAAECRGISMLWTLLSGVWIEDPFVNQSGLQILYWIAVQDINAANAGMAPEPPVPWGDDLGSVIR